jgi:hypothetical protein
VVAGELKIDFSLIVHIKGRAESAPAPEDQPRRKLIDATVDIVIKIVLSFVVVVSS